MLLRIVDGMLVVAATLAVAGCATTVSKAPKQMPIPEDLRTHVEEAEFIGQSIYLQDKASWIATDVLVEEIGSLKNADLGGWLTFLEADEALKPTDTWLVEFFSREEPPRILYKVWVPMIPYEKASFERLDPPRAANPGEALMIKGRQAAIDAIPDPMRPMNTVVLAGDSRDGPVEGGMLVYLFAATTTPNVMVLGKHYRVRVSEEDGTVRNVTELSRSNLEIPITAVPEGTTPVGVYATHIVTDWPLETHVFANLQHDVPIIVLTNRGAWYVNKGKIGFITDRIPQDPADLFE